MELLLTTGFLAIGTTSLGNSIAGPPKHTLVRWLATKGLTNTKLWFANESKADQRYQGASSGFVVI